MSPDVYFNNFFNTYLDSSEVMYYLFYQSVYICYSDNNDNPDRFSAYAVNIDGTSTRIAEASPSKLQDLRDLAGELATRFGWDFNDETQIETA